MWRINCYVIPKAKMLTRCYNRWRSSFQEYHRLLKVEQKHLRSFSSTATQFENVPAREYAFVTKQPQDSLTKELIIEKDSNDDVWQETMEKTIPSIVCIEFMTPTHFDTFSAGSSKATGFVVDYSRGIILTNRHVVRAGPVQARAKFNNLEEVELTALWCDPIHDFGFYQYNPRHLLFQEHGNHTNIKLDPSGAKIGVPIRVLGNDSGEKLSILSGIMARLDRDAPKYGVDKYNDNNTFYYQAASMTSGGSSGSPVINREGKAIALNAGGSKRSASSFFLPLDRPARALKLLQEGKAVPRGTIQTIFLYETYDEIRRLGLSSITEKEVRKHNPGGTGMLTISVPVKNGPGDEFLNAGDILVRMNSELILDFIHLEEILDNNVGKSISVEIDRAGEQKVFEISVQDLYSICPDEYIEFGGGILSKLSFHWAINYFVPVEGIMVESHGYLLRRAGILKRSVITQVGEAKVSDLDTFEKVIASYPNGSFVPVKHWSFVDKHAEQLSILKLDFTWHLFNRRSKITQGHWKSRLIETSKQEYKAPQQTTLFPTLSNLTADFISKSFVVVKFSIPYLVSGIPSAHYRGTGVIVDAERGLIIVDKETVPFALGDVTIIFNGSIELSGRVKFVHPTQHFAILSYDTEAVQDIPLKPITISKDNIDSGDQCYMVGLNSQGRTLIVSSAVTQIEPLSRGTTSVEAIHTDAQVATIGGVLCDKEGRVYSLWQAFRVAKDISSYFGAAINTVMTTIERFQLAMDKGETMNFQSLEVEFRCIPEYEARHQGLTKSWIQKLQNHSPNRRQVLQVRRTIASAPASNCLKEGDLLLTINDSIVSSFQDVNLLTQDQKIVHVTLWRDNKEENFEIETVSLNGLEPHSLLLWAGALVQDSYRELLLSQKEHHKGVYVSRYNKGSPAEFYRLGSNIWILDVNGIHTPTLASFHDAVKKCTSDEFIRITTVSTSEKRRLVTLKPNFEFWPTVFFSHRNGEWSRYCHETKQQ